jgi:AraC-like DNA-binding protein
MRTSLKNAEVRCPTHELITAEIPLRNSIKPIGGELTESLAAGSIGHLRTNEGFAYRVRDCDLGLVSFDTRWADDIARDLANENVDLQPARRVISAHHGLGASFYRMVNYAWSELGGNLRHPSFERQIEETLVTLYWLAVMDPNEAPSQGSVARPIFLRRAEEFMASKLNDPPSLARVASVAGVSASTLTRAFRKRHGIGPMGFLKQRRLEAVRDRLLDIRDKGTTVTEIATEFGFFHLGQFASDYRKRFGEFPSSTLLHCDN